MSAETKTTPEAGSKQEPPRGLFLGALALGVIYAASFGIAFLLPSQSSEMEHHAGEGLEEAQEVTADSQGESGWERALEDIPTLVVNLARSGGKRYAKVGITLEFSAKNVELTREHIKRHEVPLRDRLIHRISIETLEAVDDPEHKQRLKMDILAAVREVCFQELEGASLLRIYYREFIIQ